MEKGYSVGEDGEEEGPLKHPRIAIKIEKGQEKNHEKIIKNGFTKQ